MVLIHRVILLIDKRDSDEQKVKKRNHERYQKRKKRMLTKVDEVKHKRNKNLWYEIDGFWNEKIG